jgi:1-acyl-sn-glycerol-3-phosphate acyltransferase
MAGLVRLRAAWRLLGVGLHLGRALATAGLVYPLVSPATRRRLKRRWSATLLRRLGVVLDARGTPAAGALLVANHVSWLDIYVINALTPAVFVAKAEVRRWPLIGWLCVKTDTLFVNRGSSRDARAVGAAMGQMIASGHSVAVFPEGTTTDGGDLLPFKPALLQPAVTAGVPVQPLLLRYIGSDGERSTVPAYIGETSLWQSLWAIASERFTVVELDVLPPVAGASDRRALAQTLESQLRERLLATVPCRVRAALPRPNADAGEGRALPQAVATAEA